MPDQQDNRLGQQIGEYRLMSQLGGGSFGTVYLAEHIHEHTQAAVKVHHIPLTQSKDFKDFINEASMVRLRHPHIVPLLNFGVSRDDLPFLVMEYAPKGTLRDHHPKGERLPLSTIVSYVDQLASGLQYAHDQRIIHRDIKPENILVRADGTLMVSDFGIAKLLEQSVLISQQTQVGTPVYMAPEQYMGYPCFASDQYALAVIIYEWICGIRPFQGPTIALAMQHMNTPPLRLRDHLPELSESVERVIIKALAKAPEDRFERIEEMASALHEAVQAPSRVVPNPTIQAPLVLPPPLPSQKPEAFIYNSAGTGLALTKVADDYTSYQRPAPVLHPSPPYPPQNTVSSPPQKRSPNRRVPLIIGAMLVIISLLVVLILILKPLLFLQGGSTPTPPTHSDKITQKWTFTTTGPIYSSPTVANGVLYSGSSDGSVYAIDANTGEKQWIFSAGDKLSAPTVQNDVLYIGSDDKNIYAIDANTGQKIWTFPTGDHIRSALTVVNGVLYFGSEDHKVYAVNANTGQQIWAFPTDGAVASSPTVVNGTLYVGSQDHNIYAINTNTGQKIWAFLTKDAILSSPTVANGILYIGSWDKNIYAIDTNTGQQIWATPTGDAVLSSPKVSNGTVYIGSNDHKIYALNANTGQQQWTFATNAEVYSSPTVVNGILYIGSLDHNIYAIDANTGQKIWTFPTNNAVYSSPTVVNGVLYVGSSDGNVYALTLPAS